MIGVRICGEFADDLAMPAMNAIEDTDGEPGIFGGYFFKGMIMSHGMKKAAIAAAECHTALAHGASVARALARSNLLINVEIASSGKAPSSQ